MRNESPVVEFRNVSRFYREGGARVTALSGIDLVLNAGDFATVMGPSGGGKTTLLNCIGGLDTPDEGEILLKGRPTRGMDDRELTRLRREEIGFVFQFFNLLPTLSVYENVELPLLLGRRAKNGGERIRSLLDYVGLLDRAASFPAELSGGEMQRVAIARALVHRPSLLLADEPTGNLDSENGARILSIMQAAAADFGTTVVIVTHNPRMTSAGNRHFEIRDGRLTVHA